MPRSAPSLPAEWLQAALETLELRKQRIEEQIAQIRALTGSRASKGSAPASETPKRRRRFSAATRKRMAESQRKRWAAAKQAKPGSTPPAGNGRKTKAAK